MRRLLLALGLLWALPAHGQQLPFSLTQSLVPEQASADAVSSLVLTAPLKALYSLSVKIGATSGYVMVFDAAALPSNGAVTPKWCAPVTSNATNGFIAAQWASPMLMTNGVVVGFSTTGCDTLTASATAKFMAQAL